jgi:tetratricopeptide (TPR) repeat protein
MKAFLSHSSRDAEFVHAVANELGRQFTWLDQQAFDTGDEFISAMERGLSESSVFVLFASRHALESIFVEFEITEARRQLIAKSLDRVLVFIVDPSITYRDLPSWLQRAQSTAASAPKPVARAVRHALDQLARSRQQALFVGRSKQIAEVEGQLLPVDGSTPPRAMVLIGLPSIGRRTLAGRVARDHWNLPRLVQVPVETGDSVADVAIKLADRFEAYNTIAAFKAISDVIAAEASTKLNERVAGYIRAALGAHELPTFIDDGGLLGNEAEPSDVTTALLDIVRASGDIYVAFILRRRPAALPSQPGFPLAVISVPPLSGTETRQLIAALAGRDQLVLGPDLVAGLAEAAAGYPPSAYHVIELVKSYGPDVAVGDRSRLTSSRLGPLIRYLRTISLTHLERDVLRVLGANSPLPLVVLGKVLNAKPSELAPVVARLIDSCLVIPGDEGYYWLAEPVTDVVGRLYPEVSKDMFAAVADELDEFIKQADPETPRLDLARALHRAHLLADDERHRESAFSLTSDLVRAAELMYHRRDYKRAVDYATEAMKARPRNYDVRYTLSRALIKLGEFERAAQQIEELRRMGHLRESAFLTGFLERNRGRLHKAIEAYEAASQRGYGGLSIHRELAQCYLGLGDLQEAKRHIAQAARVGSDNRFVVDLEIQIATKERDEATAVGRLALLEAMDDPEFYYHRRSTVLAAFGHDTEALDAARESLRQAGRPTFAMLSQIAVCEIRAGRLPEATEHIARLDREFPNHNPDVRIGLRCQLEIAHRRYEDALVLWEKLSDKTRPVHLALRRNAIAGLLTGALTDARRRSLQDEQAELNTKLGGYTDRGLELALL